MSAFQRWDMLGCGKLKNSLCLIKLLGANFEMVYICVISDNIYEKR